MKNKSIIGELGSTARWSFQGQVPNPGTAWAEPTLVMVDARNLSKMACEDLCLAVPAGQKSEFIQQFPRENRWV